MSKTYYRYTSLLTMQILLLMPCKIFKYLNKSINDAKIKYVYIDCKLSCKG
jgi:hypothetical protein